MSLPFYLSTSKIYGTTHSQDSSFSRFPSLLYRHCHYHRILFALLGFSFLLRVLPFGLLWRIRPLDMCYSGGVELICTLRLVLPYFFKSSLCRTSCWRAFSSFFAFSRSLKNCYDMFGLCFCKLKYIFYIIFEIHEDFVIIKLNYKIIIIIN